LQIVRSGDLSSRCASPDFFDWNENGVSIHQGVRTQLRLQARNRVSTKCSRVEWAL
jgi:hypothetical protein